MHVLFVHNNFPAQYKHIASALAADPGNKLAAIGSPTAQAMPNIALVQYRLPPQDVIATHPFARRFDLECRRAEQVLYAAAQLASEGFVPDLIMVHNGWGENLPLRSLFPKALIIVYCEYYYRAAGQDVNFDSEFPGLSIDGVAALAAKNANILLSLADADLGIAPTHWQRATFPKELQSKIEVVHEGIDTAVVRPDPSASLEMTDGTIFRKGDQVVTFVCRNLEPLRGYHIFMRALPEILRACPEAHVLIVGGDQVSYGAAAPSGSTWKDIFYNEVKDGLDQTRIHFLGQIPYGAFLKVLQISAAHVYLTYPFVLSWSLLEAMSTECTIIAGNVAPVREFLDESCGILVPFHDHAKLADRVIDVLQRPSAYGSLGPAARDKIVEKYDSTRHCLPQLVSLCLCDPNQNREG